MRTIAPAGSPVAITDLARWAWTAAARRPQERLRRLVRDTTGVPHVFLVSTGRAGMTLLLRALRRIAGTGRDEVIVPAYTCFSVPASIVKAGLHPRVVDIDPATLDYAPEALAGADFRRVLAIVATNLFGLPSNMPAHSWLAHRQGVFLVDDAAQAMGASIGGRLSGTWGDVGLYSLDKGKNVSAIDGGIVVTADDRIAAALRHELRRLPAAGVVAALEGIVKGLGYSLLLRPWLYGLPSRIPQLGLGRTVYTTEFSLSQPSRPLAALAATMFRKLPAFTRARQANAVRYQRVLLDAPGLRMIREADGSAPVYLRFPVLVEDAELRRRALSELPARGLGVTGSYPEALVDVPELRGVLRGELETTGGRAVARQIVTLPTHPYVAAEDIERVGAFFQRATGISPGPRQTLATATGGRER